MSCVGIQDFWKFYFYAEVLSFIPPTGEGIPMSGEVRFRAGVPNLQTLFRNKQDQILDTVGVTPLIVIPADDLRHIAANHLGGGRVDNG